MVTNCKEASLGEASLGKASYSLWTNLTRRKRGISIMVLDKLEDQVSHTWIFRYCVATIKHIYY